MKKLKCDGETRLMYNAYGHINKALNILVEVEGFDEGFIRLNSIRDQLGHLMAERIKAELHKDIVPDA